MVLFIVSLLCSVASYGDNHPIEFECAIELQNVRYRGLIGNGTLHHWRNTKRAFLIGKNDSRVVSSTKCQTWLCRWKKGFLKILKNNAEDILYAENSILQLGRNVTGSLFRYKYDERSKESYLKLYNPENNTDYFMSPRKLGSSVKIEDKYRSIVPIHKFAVKVSKSCPK